MLIVVLGGGISANGDLPPHVYQRLNKAILLFKKHPGGRIALSGKYSFLYGKEKPLSTEAEKMAEYLINQGISKKDILLEKLSKDSIGNAYYLKKSIFIPQKERAAIVVTSSYHLERTRYIFKKIFGSSYSFEFIGVLEHLPFQEEKMVAKRQKELLLKIKQLLSNMKDGDHNFLKDKLYKLSFYREKRPNWVTQFVAKGK